MNFSVSPPNLNAAKRCYTFELEDPPYFGGLAKSPDWTLTFEAGEETTTRLQLFLARLAECISTYFSKKVDPAYLQSKLIHIWEPPGSYILHENRPAKATWIPASFVYYTNRCELHWCCQTIQQDQEVPSAAASGAAQGPLPVPDMTTTSAALREIEATAIPLERRDEAKAARVDAREKVRRARLRVAIAKLRAEELAERYYRRYGGFDGVDSDSELSDASVPPRRPQ